MNQVNTAQFFMALPQFLTLNTHQFNSYMSKETAR